MKTRLLLTLTALLLALSSWADGTKIGRIHYNLNSRKKTASVTYTDNSSYSGYITIPASVTYRGRTYSVTSIGVHAFYYCTGLTSITIPNSVTSIGREAFIGCTGLTSITIPSSVKSIELYAFYDCTGLTSVTIPSSVRSIGDDAFLGCTGLTSITACKMEPSEYNCSTYAFDDVPYSSVTLYVPAGSARAYRALEPWSNFSNIVETDLTSIQTPR